MSENFCTSINDQARLQSLRDTNLLDTPAEAAFDRLTLLLKQVLNVPTATISLVDSDRQFFKSAVGLDEPWATLRQTPLTHSFCQHTVETAQPLIVNDAREHPLLKDSLAIQDMCVIAYAGAPLTGPDGKTVGALCAIDSKPRQWTEHNVSLLLNIAGIVSEQIETSRNNAAQMTALKAAHATETKFKTFMDHSPAVAYIKDEEGRLLYVNKTLSRYYPNAESWVGKLNEERWPAEVAKTLREHDLAAIANESGTEVEEYVESEEVPGQHWLTFKFPLNDGAGRTLLGGMSINIDKRKREEAALRASELKVRAIYDSALQFIGLLETDGTVIDVNATALSFINLPLSSVVGKFFWDCPWWTHSPAATEQCRRAVERAAAGDIVRLQTAHIAADGQRIEVDFSLTPMRNPQGRITHLIPEGRDVTPLRTIEKELLQTQYRLQSINEDLDFRVKERTTDLETALASLGRSESRMRFMADNMPQIVWTCTQDGEAQYFNHQWFEYTGLTFDQSQNDGWKQVLHPDDLEMCNQTWTHSLSTGTVYEIEYRFKCGSDGSYRWHLGRALPHRDAAGNIVEWVGTSTDIHDQKMTATALATAARELEARVAERTSQLEKEKRFVDAILNNVSDGIIACDAQGAITLFNRSVRELHGEGADSMTPDQYSNGFGLFRPDGITPLSLDQVPLRRALSGEIFKDVELVIRSANDVSRRVITSGRALIDEAGRKFGAVIGIHDITERAAAEERFRVLFECSSNAHLLFDETGTIDCNDAAVKLLKCGDKAKLMSVHPATFSPELQPDGRRSMEKCVEMDHIARKEGFHRFEWLYQKTDGTQLPVEVSLTPVRLSGKDALLVVWHDLTQRIAVEKKFRQLFEHSTQPLLFVQSGRVLDANKATLELLACLDKSKLLSVHPSELSPVLQPDGLSSKDKRFAMEAVLKEKGSHRFDWVLRKFDGTEFPVEVSLTAIQLEGVDTELVVWSDLTERSRTEANIARQKQFMEAVLENVSDGIVACDLEHRITYLNPESRRMLGLTNVPNDLTAEWAAEHVALFDPISQQQLSHAERPLGRALKGETVNAVEALIKPANGTPRRLLISARSITDADGTITGAVAAWHDVTELHRSQQELRLAKETAEAGSRAKGDFLANMSHEIRTPMTSIIGYADLLSTTERTQEERQEFVQTIRRNGEHLLNLINDLLDLSKIDSGKMTVECISVSPERILAEVESPMRVLAADKQIDFIIDRQGDIPEVIQNDPTRIRQILLNLVSNAIKFTKSGFVRISVVFDASSQMLVYSVQDTGIGLTTEQQDSLFQPFMQADASTTRQFGGTGLGLALSKQLVEMLGGTLTVQSTPGQGSTFSFSVRNCPDDIAHAYRRPAVAVISESREPAQRLSARVLLAEDAADNRRLVTIFLEQAGMTVDQAANGRIAVDKAIAAASNGMPYDAILMDMQMPELDGYGATRELRARGLTDVPVIAFTAHAMESERQRCTDSGCDGFVTKPVNPMELINTISNQVNNKRSEKQMVNLPIPSSARETETALPARIPTDAVAGSPECRASVIKSTMADYPGIAEIIAGYVADLPTIAKNIDELFEAQDLLSLQRLAHQVRGTGGGYGFDPISQSAGQLEDAIRANESLDAVGKQVSDLLAIFQNIEGYVKSNNAVVIQQNVTADSVD